MKTITRSILFAAAFGMIAIAQPAVTGALNTAS
jgi:hypothetical protein